MLNEFLRLAGLAMFAFLMFFAAIVATKQTFGQQCTSTYPDSKAHQSWCTTVLARGVTPAYLVKDKAP
ncbi:hypothetical protein E8K88_02760 [Lampropedia aestuarii]|uniref:Uncharacterized protein n=1 Tax=Lampropedia aestuarii TaxID=2562762 RepID=A0A4V3YXS4_9BURK|nr:hypothetical protein [Lampropedia aestuarii]THJ36202.1 hypothetical protein E8K88_02760 [Lampropedia aestuarii]